DLAADALGTRFKAKHLHWGGGSPTMLKGPDWSRIIDRLRDRFDIDDTAAIAVELDPRTATEDYVKALATAGVNRASIGVQSFDDDIQKAINRIQPYAITAQVIGWLRDNDINDINMDMMYGLPNQTVDMVAQETDMAIGLKPVRVALFGYAHVPWMKSHMKMIDEDALPDADERWKQFEVASKKFIDAGYIAVGLDHFALPDDEMAVALESNALHRNFQGYTADSAPAMLGFGASAIGHLPQGYIQNASPLKEYRDTVSGGEFAIARGFALAPEDRLRSEIIERLMCDLAVDLDEVAKRHNADVTMFIPEMAKLTDMANDGIVTIGNNKIQVTETGRPFVRLVAAAFDAYLSQGKARHSRAV
ncbi:MAG: oxygen-independent coproporphyrinogen III oxidase, partial [Rhodospirillaceae bacterium]|nr:oxygen-independent coproporphyrinogen III oxidase [Rhodospirillaceae bacterium]